MTLISDGLRSGNPSDRPGKSFSNLDLTNLDLTNLNYLETLILALQSLILVLYLLILVHTKISTSTAFAEISAPNKMCYGRVLNCSTYYKTFYVK